MPAFDHEQRRVGGGGTGGFANRFQREVWALTKSCWCLYPEMLCFVHHSFVDEHACLWSDGQMVNGLVEEENGKAAGITHAQVSGTMGEGTRGAFETAQHYQGRGHMSVACDDSVSYHVPLRSKHL